MQQSVIELYRSEALLDPSAMTRVRKHFNQASLAAFQEEVLQPLNMLRWSLDAPSPLKCLKRIDVEIIDNAAVVWKRYSGLISSSKNSEISISSCSLLVLKNPTYPFDFPLKLPIRTQIATWKGGFLRLRLIFLTASSPFSLLAFTIYVWYIDLINHRYGYIDTLPSAPSLRFKPEKPIRGQSGLDNAITVLMNCRKFFSGYWTPFLIEHPGSAGPLTSRSDDRGCIFMLLPFSQQPLQRWRLKYV